MDEHGHVADGVDGAQGAFVVPLGDGRPRAVADVGGKAAGLAALTRIPGARTAEACVVTTRAYRATVAGSTALDAALDGLGRIPAEDHRRLRDAAGAARVAVTAAPVPVAVGRAIRAAVAGFGDGAALAVRSSATAEDLPTMSFAGQHASVLDVVGPDAVFAAVRHVWASLFDAAAVTYRAHHGVDHRAAGMAVVLQRMVAARASGVLFTADPVSGHRAVTVIEAVTGTGEALVSGRAEPEVVTVRDGDVVHGARGPGDADTRTLTAHDARRLAALGRRLEAHLGAPQDVEWALADDDPGPVVLQTRPITTLFPVPGDATTDDGDDDTFRVFVSTGHQQMMTDAMSPLGISLWRLIAAPRMFDAAGRLFVDVAPALASPARRHAVLAGLEDSDPLVGHALRSIVARGDVGAPDLEPGAAAAADPVMIDPDPDLVPRLMERGRAANRALRERVAETPDTDLVDLVHDDLAELRRMLFDPGSTSVFMTAINASAWLDAYMERWLGEVRAADALTRSVPHDVTSEMGHALLDVADVVRPHPEVVEVLSAARETGDLRGLPDVPGGPAAQAAIDGFLATHGMRCVGEIDIARPRWAERPGALSGLLLAHVRDAAPGEGPRRVEEGRAAAAEKERDLLDRLAGLPDGARKAEETRRMIARLRAFMGYREFPKYVWMERYAIYREALRRAAERLVASGALAGPDDVVLLTLPELRQVARSGVVDGALVARRCADLAAFAALTPPRVITSAGEIVHGTYDRGDAPAGALVGLPVSAGVAEGRARVLEELDGADLTPGDILVTRFTDPSWCAAFVSVGALVTEVGGRMTHGAVVAREYGLPAVVGVPDATRLIADGDRIRVDGTRGHIEVLGPA